MYEKRAGILTFMGSSKNIICAMFYVWLSHLLMPCTLAVYSLHDPQILDNFVHDHAEKVVERPHTGTLYNISLPFNFSGIEVSLVRLRSGSFWNRGRNSSFVQIPPRIIPSPYVKRLDIIYQNLGNWSSYYYHVPNYTLVAPVIGFSVYGGDSNSSSNRSHTLTLTLRGDPILIRFPNVSLKESDNVTMKCVRLRTNGTFQFSNVAVPNLCSVRDQGHFSIVVPYSRPNLSDLPTNRKKKGNLWKWLVAGVGASIILGLFGFLVYQKARISKIHNMEKKSEKSETLGIVLVGRSRMPSASGVRTQPILEDDYIP